MRHCTVIPRFKEPKYKDFFATGNQYLFPILVTLSQASIDRSFLSRDTEQTKRTNYKTPEIGKFTAQMLCIRNGVLIGYCCKDSNSALQSPSHDQVIQIGETSNVCHGLSPIG